MMGFLCSECPLLLFAWLLIECGPPTEVIVAKSIYWHCSVLPGWYAGFFYYLIVFHLWSDKWLARLKTLGKKGIWQHACVFISMHISSSFINILSIFTFYHKAFMDFLCYRSLFFVKPFSTLHVTMLSCMLLEKKTLITDFVCCFSIF